MKVIACFLVSLLVLSACSDKEKRVLFDGKYYPTKAKSAKGDRENFTVRVRKVEQGLDGAREAGRHAGVKYCIETFGYSEIDWRAGPDAKAGNLLLDGGNLTFTGRCRVWE